MHQSQRTQAIRQLVVHVNVGPEIANGAASLLGYLQGIDAGYHAIFDDAHSVLAAPDNVVVWGNGGINSTSLDGCIIGTADQTVEQWLDPYSRGAITQAAVWFAGKCKLYGIPVVRLTPDEVRAGGHGICGHIDVTNAGFSGAAGHYDPGPNFPWDLFLGQVAAIVTPAAAKPPVQPENDMQVFTHPRKPDAYSQFVPAGHPLFRLGALIQRGGARIDGDQKTKDPNVRILTPTGPHGWVACTSQRDDRGLRVLKDNGELSAHDALLWK